MGEHGAVWKNESNVELEHGDDRRGQEDNNAGATTTTETTTTTTKSTEEKDETPSETIEFEGEMDEIDFEHIEIKHDEHFVLVDDFQMSEHREQEMDGDKVEEWLLV